MRIYFSIFLLVCWLSSSGQSFAPIGASWTYQTAEFWIPGSFPTTWKVVKDTSVLGKDSKLIKIQQGGGVWWEQLSEIVVYDDSGVVYWFNPLSNSFSTFINFNADSGDSWTSLYPYGTGMPCEIKVHVDSTDSIVLNGKMLKRLYVQFHDSLWWPRFSIVEQIGFFESLNNNFSLGLYPGGDAQFACEGSIVFDAREYHGLRCFEDSIVGLIKFTLNADCNFNTVSTNALNSKTEIKIFPNPASDFLYVEFSQNEYYKLPYSIINAQGKEVQAGYFTNRLDISTLSQGIYLLQISGAGIIHSEIFMKQL